LIVNPVIFAAKVFIYTQNMLTDERTKTQKQHVHVYYVYI